MTHKLMLETYPKHLGGVGIDILADCIPACFECAQGVPRAPTRA